MRWLAVAAALAACDARDRGPRWKPAGAAVPRDGGTLRFSVKDSVRTLDAVRANDEVSIYVLHAVLDTLLAYEPGTLQLVPRLAESWELSPDGLTYRFWLRDRLRYADGTPIRAGDVKASLERAMTTADSSFQASVAQIAGAQAVIDGAAKDCSGIVAPTNRELAITLTAPSAGFRFVLALPFAAPQPPGYRGDWPLATGPFAVAEWDRGRRVVMVRNEHYDARERRHLDRIEMRENVPRDIQLMMFERGELDAAERLSAPDLLWLLEQPAWQPYLHRVSQVVSYGMRMNTRKPPFDDRRVRQALNYALDKQSTVKLMTGRAVASHGALPPGVPGRDEALEPYPHDPARARALLREAGHAGGLVLDYVTLLDEDAEKLAMSMQADLAEVGVTVNISLMTFAAWSSAVSTPDGPAFSFTGWAADPDPSAFFDPLFHSKSIGAANNDTYYANPEVDRLLDEARAAPDPARRAELYARVDRLIRDDAPWLWNYHEQLTEVVQPYVRGPTLHPVWVRDYTTAWLDVGADGEPVPR